MSILLTTRKRLWAKAGNRCAICKIKLVASGGNEDEDTNIGEECHIISEQKLGPRYRPGLEDYDEYENLILLCRNHHKVVDTLVDTYTEEVLRFMKKNHENKIDNVLDKEFNEEKQSEKPRFLKLITSGKELLNLARGALASSVQFDDSPDDRINKIIAELIDSTIDYGEIDDFMTTLQAIEGGKYLDGLITELKEEGFAVYADNSVQTLTNADKSDRFDWPVFSIYVKKVK